MIRSTRLRRLFTPLGFPNSTQLGTSVALLLSVSCQQDTVTVELSAPLGVGQLALSAAEGHLSPPANAELPQPATAQQTQAVRDYTLFEADPVRPIAVLENSDLVAVANTVDDYLELFHATPAGLEACGQLKVGMRPVAVAAVRDTENSAELWVTNHISDSVSVVEVQTDECRAEIVDTLHVGDEPRDIVVTRSKKKRGKRGDKGTTRVFVATAHRGQHHPSVAARTGADLITPPSDKDNKGLADVFVFDPDDRDATPRVVNLFSDRTRALTVSGNTVYAAGFHTGNRTSSVPGERTASRGVESLASLLETESDGSFTEVNGNLVLKRGRRGGRRIEGGMPAVSGSGRCMPDPRPRLTDMNLQQICVATDERQRAVSLVPQVEGEIADGCQCTSGDGTIQPTAAVVVQFFSTRRECRQNFKVFPDGTGGCWLDAAPSGASTPAAAANQQSPPMEWNDDVKFTLPDQDVFAINANTLKVTRAFSGVGTVLFSMATQPNTGKLYVTNTEASNLTRFEGHGDSSSTTVRGHLHESRITVLNPKKNWGGVQPVHLNNHIDFSQCCDRVDGENEMSFAFPTAGTFSDNGKEFFFTALGSNKVGMLKASALNWDFDNERARNQGKLREVSFGDDFTHPAGPVGLTWDSRYQRLYVKTHFTNEVAVLEPDAAELIQRFELHSPEPASIRDGRHVMYNARLTSSHGDSACASCHVFGDLDSLAWDLGDPDGATLNNPGPYLLPPEQANALGILVDPQEIDPANRTLNSNFRSNKGAMTTQTLRGLDNHGAQHWRGDRTRRSQQAPGAQPNFGSLDEFSSFGEFDVAVEGLNGNDEPLPGDVFDALTEFALQLTLPPNPIRDLSDELTPSQSAGRELYFGCASMTEAQYAARQCVSQSGNLVDIDQASEDCTCALNPFVQTLSQLPQLLGFVSLLGPTFANDDIRHDIFEQAFAASDLPPEARNTLASTEAILETLADALSTSDLTLQPPGLLPESSATLVSQITGTVLSTLNFLSSENSNGGLVFLSALTEVFANFGITDPSVITVEGLQQTFTNTFGVSNLNVRAAADVDREGTAEFRAVLNGCSLSEIPTCELRITDSLHTCNSCHVLDPSGNAEHQVARPGFFGTDGGYTFDNISQILKIPHLRNAYQKTGAFGTMQFATLNSTVNAGILAKDTPFVGPQLRGFGFSHDGSVDTPHRFLTGFAFAQSDINPDGFEIALPPVEDRAACVEVFRDVSPKLLAPLSTEGRELLGNCLSSSPFPDVCFVTPEATACQQALDDLSSDAGDPELTATFVEQIRPACFLLGFDAEGRSNQSACYAQGRRERDDLQDFTLAFDTNLKPIVGQQVTVGPDSPDSALFQTLFQTAQQGQCDLALRVDGKGWLVSAPNAETPNDSALVDAEGNSATLGELRELMSGAATLTCYPPELERASARRAAFDRLDRPLAKVTRPSAH